MAELIPLETIAQSDIDHLLDAAFSEDRKQRTAYMLRDGTEMLGALSFAAIDDNGEMIGSIQCWPIALTGEDGKAHPMIMVGPVAVHPDHQGEGIGKALMAAMLDALNPAAPLPLVMIGDAEYYGRFFGFSAAQTGGWQLPGPYDPARLLCLASGSALLPSSGTLGPWRAHGR